MHLALHGHPHDHETPPHGHAMWQQAAAALPGKTHLFVPAMLGRKPESACAPSRPGPSTLIGVAHDPPPDVLTCLSVLRI